MRFLVDANLSPTLVDLLEAAGHQAAHVARVLTPDASDDVVLAWAAEHGHVVVTADTDFGELHALARTAAPSVILFRRQSGRRASNQAALILEHLADVEDDLERGAIVTVEAARIRVRALPIEGGAGTAAKGVVGPSEQPSEGAPEGRS